MTNAETIQPVLTPNELGKGPWAVTPEGPHAFLQYKNTDICIDVRCVCGESTHFDGFFAAQLRCGACGAFYLAHWYIQLHPIPAEVDTTSSAQTTERDDDPE